MYSRIQIEETEPATITIWQKSTVDRIAHLSFEYDGVEKTIRINSIEAVEIAQALLSFVSSAGSLT